MKTIILNASILAFAICTGGNTHAQSVATENTEQQAVTLNDPSVLKGNWTVSTNGKGQLFIFDKDNNIVKVVNEKGQLDPVKKTIVFNSSNTYPLQLRVDDAGSLHIIDHAAIGNMHDQVAMLPKSSDGFSDPDKEPTVVHERIQLATVKRH